ncbi:NifU family protein [Nisaea acidiphila]|uniref:NifU family protein n=1 Tax=Nisaea acidiphila TaxID=1862145 RepID=A0A9J7B3B9_9PROT|nr:NifU family protein [Nisaea acidiphila]UUX52133.1 NifU family protein [Nisaea acidiphila]
MFIQTEETPNPATLKFLPGRDVMGTGTAEFRSEEEAAGKSPLAERLFDVDGVTGIFFGGDFITVAKRDDKEWYLMKPAVLGVIMEHFTAGRPVVTEDAEAGHNSDGEDSEVVSQIKELLDTRVRPAVAMDGGDIVFESFDEGIVTLYMRGACAGCPSSTATLKMGIENMLRHYIPEVREVRAAAM